MKKNGRKYRRIKKEIESKRITVEMPIVDQEVDGIKTVYLSMANIISFNPIIYESEEIKQLYINYLSNYLRIGKWNKRKYESSMLEAYKKIILGVDENRNSNGMEFYKNFIVFDLSHFLGYDILEKDKDKLRLIEKQYINDFGILRPESNLFFKILNATKSIRGINDLLKKLSSESEIKYAKKIKENLLFKEKLPFGIMVTATMSAGKSTFINSLTGKYVCLSQNMACTSKIHSIINKPFEDGFSYEYDYDLVMTAGKEELLHDNELNTSDRIYVSTHYNGGLESERIIINDSPGINFSGDGKHKLITDQLIKGRRYNLLVYVMNSTQLATNDENEHLEFVKGTIGRTPIIFIMNKIDSYNVEDENIIETLNRQIEYLRKKGFKNPVVCPVSARAGFLAKKYLSVGLSRSEERELYNYVDKFEQMRLKDYYKMRFPKIIIKDVEQEEKQLLKTSGLSYVEQIIRECIKGER